MGGESGETYFYVFLSILFQKKGHCFSAMVATWDRVADSVRQLTLCLTWDRTHGRHVHQKTEARRHYFGSSFFSAWVNCLRVPPKKNSQALMVSASPGGVLMGVFGTILGIFWLNRIGPGLG